MLVPAISDPSRLMGAEAIDELSDALAAGAWRDRDQSEGVVASLLLRHAEAEEGFRDRIPSDWIGRVLDRGMSREASLDWSGLTELLRLLAVEELSARHRGPFLAALETGLGVRPAQVLEARHAEAAAMSSAIGDLVEERAPRLFDKSFRGLQSLEEQLAAAEELGDLASGPAPEGSLWTRQLENSEVGAHVALLRKDPVAACTHDDCAEGDSPLHRLWIQSSGALAEPGPGKWECVRRLMEAGHMDDPSLQADWIPRGTQADWPERLWAVCDEESRDRGAAAFCLAKLGFFSSGGAPVYEFLSGTWPSDGSAGLLSSESSGARWFRWLGDGNVPVSGSPVALIVAIADRGTLNRKDLRGSVTSATQLPGGEEPVDLFVQGADGPLAKGFEEWVSSRHALSWSLGLEPVVSADEHEALLLALLCLDQVEVRKSKDSQSLTRPLSLAVIAGPGAGPEDAGAPDDAGAPWSLAVRLAAKRLDRDPTDSACIERALEMLTDVESSAANR